MSLNQKSTNVSLRFVLAPACLLACTAVSGSARAANTPVIEGSTLTHRSNVDGDSGQVYIYIGGAFPAASVHALRAWRLCRLYRSGIGRGFTVDLNSSPGTILFDVVKGIKVPTSGLFTFGYVNAFVNADGVQITQSPGTIDMDETLDGGQGAGGAGTTNAWAVTAQGPPFPSVTLGTTFGVSGSGAQYTFFSSSRTYSALAVGYIPSSD